MSGPIPPSDKTRNWPACNEAQKQRGFLTMKALFGMPPPRQTTGFIESLLRLVGIDWTVPNYRTLSRRQKTLAASIPYRGSQGPLSLSIPSRDIPA